MKRLSNSNSFCMSVPKRHKASVEGAAVSGHSEVIACSMMFSGPSQLSDEEELMVKFVVEALKDTEAFDRKVKIPSDLHECLDWMSQHSNQDSHDRPHL